MTSATPEAIHSNPAAGGDPQPDSPTCPAALRDSRPKETVGTSEFTALDDTARPGAARSGPGPSSPPSTRGTGLRQSGAAAVLPEITAKATALVAGHAARDAALLAVDFGRARAENRPPSNCRVPRRRWRRPP
ncbi:hypothetical protein [Streptomyces europaeiscabiei]|uniref:hypothetical protein n=1 Tax=Streptomyces europaeiscabiei TaxID=146819 RepID=UPI0029B53C11|nr:hypothetical protein [Streptomyces europaeiscabiei]MDX3618602.1 hypothetical protein [Streptomyces europaeiscabiei]